MIIIISIIILTVIITIIEHLHEIFHSSSQLRTSQGQHQRSGVVVQAHLLPFSREKIEGKP